MFIQKTESSSITLSMTKRLHCINSTSSWPYQLDKASGYLAEILTNELPPVTLNNPTHRDIQMDGTCPDGSTHDLDIIVFPVCHISGLTFVLGAPKYEARGSNRHFKSFNFFSVELMIIHVFCSLLSITYSEMNLKITKSSIGLNTKSSITGILSIHICFLYAAPYTGLEHPLNSITPQT